MTHFSELFWSELSKWSQATFGEDSVRGPIGPLKHLAKEVKEAISEIEEPSEKSDKRLKMEIVDCLFLTFDAARRAGFTIEELFELAFDKLDINRARTWGAPSADQPVEHDRSKD